MKLKITYCGNSEHCSANAHCKRALTLPQDNEKVMHPRYYINFQPEKGKDCVGFWKKAPLTLKPFEARNERR
jgi:hypothetical protein